MNILEKQKRAFDIDGAIDNLNKELKLADEEKDRCSREDSLQFDMAKGYATGIYNALEIIKNRRGE